MGGVESTSKGDEGGLEEGGIYEIKVEVDGRVLGDGEGWEEVVRGEVGRFVEGETGRGMVWEDGCTKGLLLR
jgi:hypothetical protein